MIDEKTLCTRLDYLGFHPPTMEAGPRRAMLEALRALPDTDVKSTNPQGDPGVLWEKIARDEVWVGLREIARKVKRAIENGDASSIG